MILDLSQRGRAKKILYYPKSQCFRRKKRKKTAPSKPFVFTEIVYTKNTIFPPKNPVFVEKIKQIWNMVIDQRIYRGRIIVIFKSKKHTNLFINQSDHYIHKSEGLNFRLVGNHSKTPFRLFLRPPKKPITEVLKLIREHFPPFLLFCEGSKRFKKPANKHARLTKLYVIRVASALYHRGS